jgi:hypothetical protein
MANELTLRELESEMGVELPEREALQTVNFWISQRTKAVNVFSPNTVTISQNYFTIIQYKDVAFVSTGGN